MRGGNRNDELDASHGDDDWWWWRAQNCQPAMLETARAVIGRIFAVIVVLVLRVLVAVLGRVLMCERRFVPGLGLLLERELVRERMCGRVVVSVVVSVVVGVNGRGPVRARRRRNRLGVGAGQPALDVGAPGAVMVVTEPMVEPDVQVGRELEAEHPNRARDNREAALSYPPSCHWPGHPNISRHASRRATPRASAAANKFHAIADLLTSLVWVLR